MRNVRLCTIKGVGERYANRSGREEIDGNSGHVQSRRCKA